MYGSTWCALHHGDRDPGGLPPRGARLPVGWPVRAGSRRTRPFHARGSAAHPGSAVACSTPTTAGRPYLAARIAAPSATNATINVSAPTTRASSATSSVVDHLLAPATE